MFRKMPLIMVLIIISIILLNPIIPIYIKQLLYSISLTIKSLIIFCLPFIIFSLLFKAAVMLSKNATKIIGMIIILVCCSNFISTFISHYIGMWIYNFNLSPLQLYNTKDLTALWSLNFPVLISNSKAMFGGIITGMLAFKIYPQKSVQFAIYIEKCIKNLLDRFIFFVPLFVAGFIVKMQHDGILGLITKDYTVIFCLIVIGQFGYISLIYLLLNNGSFKKFFNNIRKMLPATISGFSTMSSAASMPLLIMGVERDIKNKDLACAVVPATINIHLIGDCFAIPILSYAILKGFGMPEPLLTNYIIFTFYFIIAKFSVAAVPGGGIIVMLPILENYLGFNAEMLSLITACYILFDPIITSANVLGNGAFAKTVDNLLVYFQKSKYQPSVKHI